MLESYLARQPIFDADEQLIGYELLYRDDRGGVTSVDGDQATTEVLINSYIEIGLAKLVGRYQSFINITRNFLIDHGRLPPPTNQLVLEVLEHIEADDEVIAAVKGLREKGYRIALDDYNPRHNALLQFADVVKIDLQQQPADALEELVSSLRDFPCKLLAEKVETTEQFDYCQALGFDYFQGFFLCKPKIVRGKRLPAQQQNVMRLMAELHKHDLEVSDVEKVIEQDVALSYKLLRYINSAAFSLRRNIESIRHAIVCLGLNEVRKWASMVALSSVEGKSSELIRTTLLRAKMCELLTEASGQGQQGTAFIVGLFSTLDALMDTPLDKLLAMLPIAQEISDALLSHCGPYSAVLAYTLAYERGEWQTLESSGLSENVLASCYMQAVSWCDETSSQLLERTG